MPITDWERGFANNSVLLERDPKLARWVESAQAHSPFVFLQGPGEGRLLRMYPREGVIPDEDTAPPLDKSTRLLEVHEYLRSKPTLGVAIASVAGVVGARDAEEAEAVVARAYGLTCYYEAQRYYRDGTPIKVIYDLKGTFHHTGLEKWTFAYFNTKVRSSGASVM